MAKASSDNAKTRMSLEKESAAGRPTKGGMNAASEGETSGKSASQSDPRKRAQGDAAGTARQASAGRRVKKAAQNTAGEKQAAGAKASAGRARSMPEKNNASTGGKSQKSTSPIKSPARADKKPWLQSYPKEVPAQIGPFQHDSLADLLLESCRTFADRPAFTSMGVSLSFAALEKASRDFAAYLQSTGMKKGARLAIMMPNVLQYPVVMMAALRAGYVVVNVNPLYTPRELQYQLADSGAEGIVILENFAKTLQSAIEGSSVRHVIVASMGDMLGLKGHLVNFVVRRVKKLVPEWSLPDHVTFRQAIRQGRKSRFSPTEVKLDDIAFLQYTGGTTGIAKGAVLLHRNVLANVMQNALWLETAYINQLRPKRPIYICALPLYHIYALTVNAFMGIKFGAENVLIANARDIPALVKEMGKYDFNVLPGLNTLFNALLNNADFRKLSFRNLNLTLGGGMAVQRSVAERWKHVTGRTISEGYGLSETSPVVTANRFDSVDFSGTIGLPLPSTEVAIRDEENRDVEIGQVGEICIRGPQVMAGYWNRPDETEAAITADGFLRSGDMGVMDESGQIRIVDRKKDMIIVSGFNVYPNEIEEVVAEHPGVLEVAAIGVPDERSGEVAKLFVVKKDQGLTEQDLLDFCRQKLTGYKRPKHVEFRDELPKSNVGKIVRRELR